jgi:tRNA G18 (ribose-2'-O)-methylase SpoU
MRLDHVLTTPELRASKLSRADFPGLARNPITVVLDDVRGSYNLGAIIRLCDAFLCEQLVICGVPVALRNRRFVQAAKGAQHWVPWREAPEAAAVVRAAKADGHWIGAVELTAESTDVTAVQPRYPATLIFGGERSGVSPDVLACADQAIAIPMLGMANSLNVATAAAIVLHELLRRSPANPLMTQRRTSRSEAKTARSVRLSGGFGR